MLKVAVVVMGLLIVGGMAVLAVTMAHRLSGSSRGPSRGSSRLAAAPLLLDEPSGTSVAGIAVSGERLVLQLRGGGPDRVVVVDLGGGVAPARIGLMR